MKITLIACGKIKEKYLREAIADYTKRLTPYCKLETIEIMESKLPDNPSAKEIEMAIATEGEAMLKRIPANSYVFILDLWGKQLSSEQLAHNISQLTVQGKSHLTFVIGGPFGIADALRAHSDFALSLSKCTFTHQMIRLLVIEQIYRSFKINRHEKYHW